jgi:BirA family biotin operon repressor/biotin-[acetyl-CoA-carboxylase] ligase
VGLNLAAVPDGLAYAATSLARAAGLDVAPDAFLAAWLPHLRQRLDAWQAGGFAALRPAWLARAHRLGAEASLRLGEERISGRFADLLEDGSLVIERSPGRRERFAAGELFFP